MKHTLTSLLTIVIMVIGLALIIGGPSAVRFLFAPFIFGIRQAVRVGFVLLILLFFAVLMAGCATRYPMGLTRQQWDVLPPAQQAEFQAKQYAIDEERRKEEADRRMEQSRLAAEAIRAEQERLRQVYANARYRDIVQMTVQGGFIAYAGKRYPYEPVSVDLAKGETKQVAFYGRGLQTIATEYTARLSEDGNTIFFDDSSRQRIVMVNQDWERGQTYRPARNVNDVGVAIAGMTFFVRFKDLPGSPQRVIIERRQ